METSRAVFFCGNCKLEALLLVIAERRRLIFVAPPVLAREAKWSTEGIQQPVMALLLSSIPVFLSGREGKPEQISGCGKQAAAHAQTKSGALEQSR